MLNFDEYKQLGEPEKLEKSEIWKTAIGLQEVDGLKTSDYLLKTAKSNIEGDLTFDEVHEQLSSYYKASSSRNEIENRTEEADKVSARIAQVLSEKTFVFSPAQYLNIHKRIFEGFKFAGKVRTYNITKDEWVLHGKSVYYASADTIMDTLKYDFDTEKAFNYRNLSERDSVHHIADFLSGIWQIHPFGEGNTRATAVFAIKYLRTFGFAVENEMFHKHSWFFRNALVRANYTNMIDKIYADKSFIYNFFENLLCGDTHPLKNREMLLNADSESISQNTQNISDVSINDSNVSINDSINDSNVSIKSVYSLINANNKITTAEISTALGVSLKTVSRKISKLKQMGIIKRIGSNKTGHWEILKKL